MAEYIEREAFIKWVEDTYCKPCEEAKRDYNHCRCGSCQYDDMMRDVESFDAADVVPVVRCKDCRYSMDDKIFGGMWCRGRKVTPDWFCAHGAKMDGEA